MAGLTNGKKILGMLAAAGVYTIYGLNMVFCKDLTDTSLIPPTILFTIRTGGAAVLFWILSLFVPGEKLSTKDLGKVFLASVLCIIIPQYSTLLGITMSTPYDASLVATLKPVLTMLVAFVLGKELFNKYLLMGVLFTFAGAVVLVFNPFEVADVFSTSPLGLCVLLLNGISMAFYLVLFRDFVSGHDTVTLMKWMFLLAFLVSIPVSVPALSRTGLMPTSTEMLREMFFLVFFATFLSYFLMPVGQRYLTSTQYSLFTYVQCIVSAIVGISMGLESIDAQKLLASALFVAGVFMVRRV